METSRTCGCFDMPEHDEYTYDYKALRFHFRVLQLQFFSLLLLPIKELSNNNPSVRIMFSFHLCHCLITRCSDNSSSRKADVINSNKIKKTKRICKKVSVRIYNLLCKNMMYT